MEYACTAGLQSSLRLALKDAFDSVTSEFQWPGLNVTNADGKVMSSVTFRLNWIAAGGALLVIGGLITIPVLHISLARAARAYVTTLKQLKWAILVVTVLALAYG
jgi:lactate permease